MNACEDQSEPLGEHIDTLTAIQRGAVVGILSAADEVLATKQLAERQTKALNAIRELHEPCTCCTPPTCRECDPNLTGRECKTMRAIDEAGA
ncbi:hypothetical protein [Mycolicibacterium fortuitum]|uniref:hypothetical protein n=1 Tax=Mycolicibacterium fortuitum TaxID=1766 RepID=UPI0024204E05|nr:hypothetical protein [Mycolicibacterium fortuitum]MDG5773923.1 hypothetical protein [Mycolicibacterium fortuitum]MDG5779692.1 hypothetical protein [Mycolicibacterium fortuitum]